MSGETDSRPKLHIYLEGDDDPEKCTARRLEKEGVAVLYDKIDRMPYGTLLDPYAEKALSPEDDPPLVAVDASWVSAESIYRSIEGQYSGNLRSLPFLIAANPVNYGTAYELNTAEALAAALYITGEKRYAREVMDMFSYGEAFLKLNHQILNRYADCGNSEEVVEVQEEIRELVDD
ncbi:MAG: DUF367 family protein [Halobacteria archaeon]